MMSFKPILEDIIQGSENNYKFVTKTMAELQPIAFLLSASLILATFLDGTLYQKYVLFASLAFFLAYLGFVFYNKSRYYLLFYWSLSLLFIGFLMLYQSFGWILKETLNMANSGLFLTSIYFVVFSIPFLISRYHIDTYNLGSKGKKVLNGLFYLILLIFVITYSVSTFYIIDPLFILISGSLPVAFVFISILACTFLSHNQSNK